MAQDPAAKALAKAERIAPDPRKWYEKVADATTDTVGGRGFDGQTGTPGPVDLGLWLSGALAAGKGLKAGFNRLVSGPEPGVGGAIADDLMGLNPTMSRRQFMDRAAGNTNKRRLGYAEDTVRAISDPAGAIAKKLQHLPRRDGWIDTAKASPKMIARIREMIRGRTAKADDMAQRSGRSLFHPPDGVGPGFSDDINKGINSLVDEGSGPQVLADLEDLFESDNAQDHILAALGRSKGVSKAPRNLLLDGLGTETESAAKPILDSVLKRFGVPQKKK